MGYSREPLDLVFGRASVEAEYAFWGPLSAVVMPAYVFKVPGSSGDGYKAAGWQLGGGLDVWLNGTPMRGWYIRALAEYENITAKSDYGKVTVGNGVLGAMIGSQSIIVGGKGGGMTIGGGIGIGYKVGGSTQALQVGPSEENVTYTGCDGKKYPGAPTCVAVDNEDKLRILGNFSIGAAF